MKRLLFSILMIVGLAGQAVAGKYYGLEQDADTGKAYMNISGEICLAASSGSHTTCTIVLNGSSGTVDGYDISLQFEEIAIATAEPRGHEVEWNGVPIPRQSTINFTGDGVTVTDVGGKTVVDISTFGDTLRSTSTLVGLTSSSSQEWASVAGSTLTLVMDSSQYVGIDFSCNVDCIDFTKCGVAFGYLVDGDYHSGVTSSTDTGIAFLQTSASLPEVASPLVIRHQTYEKLAPGSHEISLLWASDGGVEVRLGRGVGGCSLTYREASEQQGSGGAMTVSGQDNYGSQTAVAMESLDCPSGTCTAQTPYGLWISTGTGVGDWLNVLNGLGPYD